MCTVSYLVESFLTYMSGRNAPGTILYYKRHLYRFLTAVGDTSVAELRKHHLLQWGKSWHAMQAVQRLFNWAHNDMELIERNPFRGIKRPRCRGRRRILTRLEAVRMLRGSDATFRGVLLALRESICRPNEARVLRWSMLRLEGEQRDPALALRSGQAHFELWEYKSRERRIDPDMARLIYVNRRWGRHLARLFEARSALDGHVYLNGEGNPWTSNAIRLRVRRLCRRLSLGSDERGEPIVAYTFRHTSATEKWVEGFPELLLAELMGHTSTRTTRRYAHPTRKHVRNAINAYDRKGRLSA